jgi:SpoVK/Ycf46/Vps4 family AAA+-type ATPase
MATTDRLSRLFHAIAARDWDRAESVATGICVEEEKKGHRTAARLLRGALHPNGCANGSGSVPSARNELAFPTDAALSPVAHSAQLAEIELLPRWRSELEEIVREWTHRDTLEAHGLQPRNKLFFYGPPGCGKSLTACAIGSELSLPVYIVRFDAVIGAYLGQTAIHLRQLFHFAEMTPCVLVLDELDALGKKRGNPLDVGELDRIVIALMQELEHARPLGVIVATSNMPKHLDDALWRRFDAVVEFPKPHKAGLLKYAKRLSTAFGITLTASLRKKIEATNCYAQAEKIIEAQARHNALKDV